ncbi:MAG: sigma-70 family RNA polymerase sigma factor [Gemmataceae bacterium]|nr:sigma-70 family RNA polymerase sigma factor [Gemmataceae bacterium]
MEAYSTPAEAAAFADQFEQLLQSLDPEGRQIIDLKLQQFPNEQAAEHMNCSTRTVTRLVNPVLS